MATGDQPTLPDAQSDEPTHDRELLRFLRDENEANRKGLREDADANRGLLLDALKITSYPLAALIAIAAFLGFKTFSDIRSQARSETKTEIQHMQSEADAETKKEIEQLRKRVDDQLQTPAVRGMVERAAKDYTENTARPLIQDETKKQVTQIAGPLIQDEVKKQVTVIARPLIQNEVHAVTQELGASVQAALKGGVREEVDRLQQRLDAAFPSRAQIRNPVYEFPPPIAGRPATVKATLKNVGELKAQNILIYAVADVSESTADASTRERIFGNLTKELQKSVQTGRSVAGAPTPPSGALSLTVNTSPLSEDQAHKLQNGEYSLHFLYTVYYSDPKGGEWITVYCGCTNSKVAGQSCCKLPDNWINDLHLSPVDVRGLNP